MISKNLIDWFSQVMTCNHEKLINEVIFALNILIISECQMKVTDKD
jgi:hypothetical protein